MSRRIFTPVLSLALVFAANACGMRERVLEPEAPIATNDAISLVGWADDSDGAGLSWSIPAGTDTSRGFRIYRNDVMVRQMYARAWADRGLVRSSTYRYRVTLIGADGADTRNSNEVSIVTKPLTAFQVTVSPSSGEIVQGSSLQLTSTVRDSANGFEVRNLSTTWSSNDAAVATVSSTGLLTANSPGVVTIAATVNGGSGTARITVRTAAPVPIASVTVSPPESTIETDRTVQLIAIVRDAEGHALSDRIVIWASSNPAVASVSNTGIVTSHAVGSALIRAYAGEAQSSALMSVIATPTAPTPPLAPPPTTPVVPVVTSVSVTPAVSSLLPGESVQLTATARDANGAVISGRTVTWHSVNTGLAEVAANGLATAHGVGSTVISATIDGATGSAVINITPVIPTPPAAVASVRISPPSVTSQVGANTQFVATAHDASGVLLAGRTVIWQTSNSGVATVFSDGLAHAVAAGSAIITATVEGVSASANLSVQSTSVPIAPVATVTVAPGTLSVALGSLSQLTATVRDAGGAVLTGRIVSWSSSNPTVATVNLNGTVSAVSAGSAVITATSEGKSGVSNVTVNAPPPPPAVHTVTVTPGNVALHIGATTQLAAATKDASGNVLNRTVTWSSSNLLVANVSSSGLVTVLLPGTATITATSEGKNGTATVVVTALPVSTVTVSPVIGTLTVGGTLQLSATARDANGALLANPVVTWHSSNVAAATVSSSGLVTGVGVGLATVSATVDGVTAAAALVIIPKVVATVQISSALPGLCAGASMQLTAVARDADGNVLTGRAVVWTSSNASIGTVSGSGLLVGLTIGSVTLTATVEGVSANITLSLCAPVVATISITSPPSLLSLLGLPLQLIAVPRDGNGNVIVGRPVTWTVTPALKALISLTGLLTPLGLGPITVTATIDGVQVSTVISITL